MISVSQFVEGIFVKSLSTTIKWSDNVVGAFKYQNKYNRFDVNGDGVIDDGDLYALLSFIERYPQKAFFEIPLDEVAFDGNYYDVDGDHVVTIRDVIQLVKQLQHDYSLDGIIDESYIYNKFNIQRDLFATNRKWIVKEIAGKFNANVDNCNYYIRTFGTNKLTEITKDYVTYPRDSILIVDKSLYEVGDVSVFMHSESSILDRIKNHLSNHRELIPSRVN